MKRITLTLTNAQETALRLHAAQTRKTPSIMVQKILAIVLGITNDPEVDGEPFTVDCRVISEEGVTEEKKTFRVDPVVVAKVVEFGRSNARIPWRCGSP